MTTTTLFASATTDHALHHAWQRVRANAGAAGTDGQSIFAFESRAHQRIEQLRTCLHSQRYMPQPLLHTQLQRPHKTPRPLSIPTVTDRIVQTAVKNALQPSAEAQFSSRSFAYRPFRSVGMALAQCQAEVAQGNTWVVDADIQKFFNSIPHAPLRECIGQWTSDAQLLRMIDLWLAQSPNGCGIGQGSPLSPLLSNLYLDALDKSFEAQGIPHVRYADDFVAFAPNQHAAATAHQLAHHTLDSLGLVLHPGKTQVLQPGDALHFLGQTLVLGNQTKTFALGCPPSEPRPPATPAANAGNLARLLVAPITAPTLSAHPITEPTTELPSTAPSLAAFTTTHYRSLYLLEPNTWCKKDGARLVVTLGKEEKLSIPAEQLHLVLAFGNTNFTAGALTLLLEHRVPIVHMTQNGSYLGTTDAASTHGLALQQAQFAAAACPARTLEIARAIVIAKLKNQHIVLKRTLRRHPASGLEPHLDALRHMRAQCQHVHSLEALRGCEGFAARSYFAALRCILPAKWQFEQRTRPPQDPINALLSLGYTLLFQNVRSLLQARGLHTHLGFLHAPRPGHPALASDMMEEFRAPVVDALVLDLCLSGTLAPHDFSHDSALGCRLQPAALKKFIHALEAKLQSPAQSGDGKPLHYRQAIEQQAHHLAAHLRQRHSGYHGYTIR